MKKIYAITPEEVSLETLLVKTERLLAGGLDLIQYRAKNKAVEVMKIEVAALKKLCNAFGVPLIMNDYADLALKWGCDGVHVGQTDQGIITFRNRAKEGFIVGATAKTVEQAVKAEQEGATYIGTGAVFPSSTKPEAIPITIDRLKEIRQSVAIPVYAIGGLTCKNIDMELIGAVDGVVLSSGLYGEDDKEAIIKIKDNLNRMKNGE